MPSDLTDASTHFRFGQNWAAYSSLIDERRLNAAIENVQSLVGDLSGKSFLDIGSGSGLFSAAALHLGARQVVAVDIDRDSVATTRKVLSAHGRGAWQAHELSVFDLPSTVKERFDVVYSWGVLHHTGDMWRALSCAAEMVAEGGTFAIALYEKTPLCGAWTLEKRAYRRLPGTMQKLLRGLYLTAWGSALVVTGRNPWRRIREGQERGMDVFHDVHDWMGGYPYESTSAPEIGGFMARLGFERVDYRPFRIIGKGVFGSGCSEYVFRKQRLARSA